MKVPDKVQETASAISGLVRFFTLNLVIYICLKTAILLHLLFSANQ